MANSNETRSRIVLGEIDAIKNSLLGVEGGSLKTFLQQNKQTAWHESVSEIYRPSNRRL
jgi:hypothetical protein